MTTVPLPPVDHVMKIEFLQLMAGAPVVNVFHAAFTGDPTPLDMTAFCSLFAGYWNASFEPLQNAVQALQAVKATDLTSDIASSASLVAIQAGAASPSQALPNGTALVVSHHISRRYRGGHPRTYFAGLSAADMLSAREWTAGTVSAWQAAWNSFSSSLMGATTGGINITEIGSVSYRSGNARRVAPVFDQFVGSAVQPRVCSQRRRLGALLAE